MHLFFSESPRETEKVGFQEGQTILPGSSAITD